MIDKAALDRYITAEPDDDGWQEWSELVVSDHMTASFYDNNYDWIDCNPVCNNWMWKLFQKYIEPELAAQIIERAYKLYINR